MADADHEKPDLPQVYSIAAHRGFADALVAGLVPRYAQDGLGLARLTLLLPSGRAIRTVSEAFVRQMGEEGGTGLLLPRMVTIGDLSLDEALGPLLDPLDAPEGSGDIPPAVDPTFRWLRLAALLAEELGDKAPSGPPLFRQARMIAETMDRLLVEDIAPDDLLGDRVLDVVGSVAGHWQDSLRRFARVQARWLAELQAMGRVDAATRRNLLFAHAAKSWRSDPPDTPIVAAGVTSAAPALARLLRVVSELTQGAVILPDLDLSLPDAAWDELGRAGRSEETQGEILGRDDAPTHPQYHLKLLLNRMGVNRGEVQQWHRRGIGAANPDRTHAVSALFLPPHASRNWVDLPSEKRRLAGVRLLELGNPEEEAQAVALAVRQALDTPRKRVAVVTPDRALARRIAQHLRRWDIQADDSAGAPLGDTPAGRALLLLTQVMAQKAAPVSLIAFLGHPFMGIADAEDEAKARADWLDALRRFEDRLRGPRPAPGLAPLRAIAAKADVAQWWAGIADRLDPLLQGEGNVPLADLLEQVAQVLEGFCGDAVWSREDGRALGSFVDDLRQQALAAGTTLDPADLHDFLSDAMERVAVRPAYGGHPRVVIYGLLESRMARADIVICAGLNEGTWPGGASPDPLLAPPVLRALGVPGGEFRIGLAAHDLAGALGAPEVLLTRAERSADGPAIPSRFFLRIKALLGDLAKRHEDTELAPLVDALRDAEPTPLYPIPQPCPPAEVRRVPVSATALDRLRSDPYQFYANAILRLKERDPLDAEPSPAWQGTLAHAILEDWHEQKGALTDLAATHLAEMDAHPLTRALWEPRLMAALEWIANEVEGDPDRQIVAVEEKAVHHFRGVEITGTADRIDRLADGTYAIVDYKTGGPPSKKMVAEGFALQLGTLGLLLAEGAYAHKDIEGTPTRFEYWSLGRDAKSDTGFGYVTTPLKVGAARSGMEPDEFLPKTREYLEDALDTWIVGSEPFTARPNPDLKLYSTYDQLMRLEEWLGREIDGEAAG